MKRSFLFFVLSIFLITGSIFVSLPILLITHAQSSPVIQSQETSFQGILAELIQCKRKKGVLTVKVRLTNTSSKGVKTWWRDVQKNVYLMDEANQKKYFILKDANGEYICNVDTGDIPLELERPTLEKVYSVFLLPKEIGSELDIDRMIICLSEGLEHLLHLLDKICLCQEVLEL